MKGKRLKNYKTGETSPCGPTTHRYSTESSFSSGKVSATQVVVKSEPTHKHAKETSSITMCIEESHLFMGWSSSDPYATVRCYHRLPAGHRQCDKAARALPRLFSFKYKNIGGRSFCKVPHRQVIKVHDLCPDCQSKQLWEMLKYFPKESDSGPKTSTEQRAENHLPTPPVPARHPGRLIVDHAGRPFDPSLMPAPLNVPDKGKSNTTAPPLPHKSSRRPVPARSLQRKEVGGSPFAYVMKPHRQSTLDAVHFGAASHPNIARGEVPRWPRLE